MNERTSPWRILGKDKKSRRPSQWLGNETSNKEKLWRLRRWEQVTNVLCPRLHKFLHLVSSLVLFVHEKRRKRRGRCGGGISSHRSTARALPAGSLMRNGTASCARGSCLCRCRPCHSSFSSSSQRCEKEERRGEERREERKKIRNVLAQLFNSRLTRLDGRPLFGPLLLLLLQLMVVVVALITILFSPFLRPFFVSFFSLASRSHGAGPIVSSQGFYFFTLNLFYPFYATLISSHTL